MIDRRRLLKDLQSQVKALERDLREQVDTVGDEYERLRVEYDRAFDLGRTAATWTVWRDERITQAAVAWVLGTVFVRFCEDNDLLGSSVYMAGPGRERMTLAEESQEEYFRRFPSRTDRDWVLEAFAEIAESQAGRLLFDREHNALYQIPVSHDAARALIGFWRRRGQDGALVHDFMDPSWDTRFLGDLYQDLSEAARKTYALLQTPDFVEQFILSLTLKPAIDEFGCDVVRVIDPTCGSGHFVLGAFRVLMEESEREAPTREAHERVRRVLNALHGVDINPFAAAIARFRLFVMSMRALEFATLEDAKGYEFPLHIAIGDSLIKHRTGTLFGGDELVEFSYATEDLPQHPGILKAGTYHVVVGNPPYVTVKDRGLNEAYRDMYDTCAGKYALSVPFAQRFFELARLANDDGKGAGYVGQITANSFMKREFGKKMIEQLFALRVSLTHVIDTSGAYIPGHGTPTVVLAGRNTNLNRAGTIRTVMGIRGEPSAPALPADGVVWQAITTQLSRPGSESEWVSVADTPRQQLASFPWSLSGGGSASLVGLLRESSPITLRNVLSEKIGFASFPGLNDAFELTPNWHVRAGTPLAAMRGFVTGEDVRDWQAQPTIWALAPYDEDQSLIQPDLSAAWGHHLWTMRTSLLALTGFGGITRKQTGESWWSWYRWIPQRYRHDARICFADVATHNHFVSVDSGAALNQHAPVLLLEDGQSVSAPLLGVLNSSTACFWLKQVSYPKGGDPVGDEGARVSAEGWSDRYEFTGTKLQEFPLPPMYPLELARGVDSLAQRLMAVSPAAVAAEATPTRERLAAAEAKWHATRTRMIALQEELDWEVYTLYGLLDDELTAPAGTVPELRLGERAFEIVLARKMARCEAETQWFARHGSTPITELPEHWPAEYRAVVERRITVVEGNRNIGLIERPECKRRWATEGWEAMQAKALREWLLDRCEARGLWFHHLDGIEHPRPLSVGQLADELRRDPDVLAVAELYAPGRDLAKVLADLVADEHVPYLAALRYKDTGLEHVAIFVELGWRSPT
jgi:hypothetical protein